MPSELAKKVTESVSIPVIGIGAGVDCDGQVLVLHDMLGLNKGFEPRFLRRYGELGQLANEAISQYVADVRAKTFPSKDESYE